MKRIYFITMFTFLFTMIAVAGAAGPGDRPMGPQGPKGPFMGDRGFHSNSSALVVSGDISIGDGITLSMIVTPSEDMRDSMHGRDLPEGMEPDMQNELSVTLIKLVEFEDLTSNGYDLNDTIVSEYLLTNDTLGELVMQEIGGITTYSIVSTDNVFEMTIEVNSTESMVHDWKWSVLIDYPFATNTSSIAMIHELSSENMNPYRHRHGERHQFTNNSVAYERFGVPMRFQWDQSAIIDGSEEDVVANMNDGQIALSMIQGDIIDYDPRLGMESDDFRQLLASFDALYADFMDTVNSPTALGLALTGVAVVSILVITRRK